MRKHMQHGLWALLASSLFCQSLYANIIITGTRVIYPAGQSSVNVQLTNQTDRPALMQAWVDDGDMQSSPSSLSATRVPFVIVPPVSRMEANAGQTLRVSYTAKKALPEDRESLFFLNVLDIPPKPKAEEIGGSNYLQIALRSRIKLFYRPNLPIKPEEAYSQVRWKKQGSQLMVENPTPYFITFSAVKINGKPLKEVGMLAPFSQKTLAAASQAGQRLQWTVINDFGGDSQGEAVVQ